MENKLIKKSAELFKDEESWESFLELQRIIPDVKQYWIRLFSEKLHKIEIPNSWRFKVKSNGGAWFLKDEIREESSISIWIENEQFSIWADPNHFSVDSIREALNTDKYSSIKDLFPYSDIHFGRDGYLLKEFGRFQYNSYSQLSPELFAWVAGNEASILIMQIQDRLDSFFSKDIESLVRQLNAENRK